MDPHLRAYTKIKLKLITDLTVRFKNIKLVEKTQE